MNIFNYKQSSESLKYTELTGLNIQLLTITADDDLLKVINK